MSNCTTLINCCDDYTNNKYPSSKCNSSSCTNKCTVHLKNFNNHCINPCTKNVINCPNNPPMVPKIIETTGTQIYIYEKLYSNVFIEGQREWFIDLNNVCNYGAIQLFTLGYPITYELDGAEFNVTLSNVNYYTNNIGDWFIVKNLTYNEIVFKVRFNGSNVFYDTEEDQYYEIPNRSSVKFVLFKITTDSVTLMKKNFWMICV